MGPARPDNNSQTVNKVCRKELSPVLAAPAIVGVQRVVASSSLLDSTSVFGLDAPRTPLGWIRRSGIVDSGNNALLAANFWQRVIEAAVRRKNPHVVDTLVESARHHRRESAESSQRADARARARGRYWERPTDWSIPRKRRALCPRHSHNSARNSPPHRPMRPPASAPSMLNASRRLRCLPELQRMQTCAIARAKEEGGTQHRKSLEPLAVRITLKPGPPPKLAVVLVGLRAGVAPALCRAPLLHQKPMHPRIYPRSTAAQRQSAGTRQVARQHRNCDGTPALSVSLPAKVRESWPSLLPISARLSSRPGQALRG